MRKIIALSLALALSGCGLLGSVGSIPMLEGGACLGKNTGSGAAVTMPGTGQITFSAPAGTAFALCAW
jgi:hypothetical protein